MRFEYRCVAGPMIVSVKSSKARDQAVKAFEDIINAEAAHGWEYVGIDEFHISEPEGFFSRRRVYVPSKILVFRRPVAEPVAAPALAPPSVAPPAAAPSPRREPVLAPPVIEPAAPTALPPLEEAKPFMPSARMEALVAAPPVAPAPAAKSGADDPPAPAAPVVEPPAKPRFSLLSGRSQKG